MPIIDIPTTSTTQTLTGDNGVTTVATYTTGGTLSDLGNNISLSGTNFDSSTPVLEVDYSAAVEDVQFTFDDVDQGSWDDQIRVLAFAPDGTPIPITFTTTSATHVIESDGSNGVLQIEGANATTDNNSLIVVTIAGPVGSFQIFYEDGDSGSNDGGIVRLEDMSFTNAQPNDGIVSGTAGDDVIDSTYLDDPNGDIVDNNDAILPGDVGNDDFIEANGGNDAVFAGDGDDEVYGGTGNDTIDGAVGDDTMFGEEGDDTFTIAEADGTDVITGGEDADGADIDTVDFSGVTGSDGVDVTYDGDESADYAVGSGSDGTFDEIEAIIGTDNDDAIDATLDTAGITANTGDGDDIITGGQGDDDITAGIGNDTIALNNDFGDDIIDAGENAGNTDVDVLDGSGLTQDVTLDLTAPETGTITNGADTTSFDGVEEFVLGSGNDSVIGSDGDDIVDLGQGTDTINAGQGNDQINLGESSPGNPDEDPDVVVLEDNFGDDVVTNFDAPTPNGDGTFTGVDTLDVAQLFDLPVGDPDRAPVNTNDVVVSDDGSGNAVLTFPNGETLTLDGIPYVDADDPFYLTAIGIPLPDGIVSGTAGNDLIDGAYLGDTDGDIVDNNDAILAGDTGDDDLIEAGAGDDSVLAGAGDDEVFGGSGDDTISGGNANDTLNGETGSDTLSGDAGADVLLGGADDDLLIGGAGDDVQDGGAGDDIFVLGDGFGTDDITGGETAEDLSDPTNGDGGDRIDASDMTTDVVLNFTNSEEGTLVSGSETANFAEIEDVHLGSGDDAVFGSIAIDTVDLGEGEDTVEGGAGDDVIGLGQDPDGTSDGDADVVVFSDNDGSDTILDFDAPIDNGDGTFTGIDTLDVSSLTDADGNPVNVADVIVSDDGSGNALLTFPNGETLILDGVAPGEVDSSAELTAIGIPCFTPGTLISTANGLRPVESLEVGDLVPTLDSGMQRIRWTSERVLNAAQLGANPSLQPIRIRAGALGNGLPLRDVCVSPQHKMMLRDAKADLLFGESEVLVAALHLVGLPGVDRIRLEEVTYVHVMFDNHQIILAEGAWTESYQPGPQVVGHMDSAQREELMLIFPELRLNLFAMKAARLTLKEREATLLLDARDTFKTGALYRSDDWKLGARSGFRLG